MLAGIACTSASPSVRLHPFVLRVITAGRSIRSAWLLVPSKPPRTETATDGAAASAIVWQSARCPGRRGRGAAAPRPSGGREEPGGEVGNPGHLLAEPCFQSDDSRLSGIDHKRNLSSSSCDDYAGKRPLSNVGGPWEAWPARSITRTLRFFPGCAIIGLTGHPIGMSGRQVGTQRRRAPT